MKIGVELSIDVTKIEKARIFEGKKGKYLTMTTFIDIDQKDQYENNGMITHKKNEGEERAPILGNCKVFWSDQQAQQHQYQQTPYIGNQGGNSGQGGNGGSGQQQQAPQQNFVPQIGTNPNQQQPNSFDEFSDDIPFS